jgi:hypothetical protein
MTPALAASVEAHLERCARCQRGWRRRRPARLDAVWAEVVDAWTRRASACSSGSCSGSASRPDTARLLAVTPSLQLSWVTGHRDRAEPGAARRAQRRARRRAVPRPRARCCRWRASPWPSARGPTRCTRWRSPRPTRRTGCCCCAAPPCSRPRSCWRSRGALLPSTPWWPPPGCCPALALTCTSLALATRVDPSCPAPRSPALAAARPVGPAPRPRPARRRHRRAAARLPRPAPRGRRRAARQRRSPLVSGSPA